MTASKGAQTAKAQWENVCRRLRDELGDNAFNSWVSPLTFRGVQEGEAHFVVPSRFVRDWVSTHYSDRIRALFAGEDARVRAVDIRVEAGADVARPKAAPKSMGGGADVGPRVDTTQSTPIEVPTQVVSRAVADRVSAPLDPKYTFENFVVGKPNEFAFAAAQRVADAATVSFNPLFLYGGVGLGKTHLMHAIAWRIREQNPDRQVAYLSAEKFMYSFIRALREKDTVAFKEQFRAVDVLMIDDIQFISGKDSTQEEFFHTFNALVDQGRQIVLSADRSPADLEDIGDRLRSRMASGLVADLHPTTYELRMGILQSKAEQLGVEISPRILEFLAHKITTNVRELEGALTRIVAHAQLMGGEVTLETTQDLLRDLLRACDRKVTIEDIQKRVAEHFQIRLADMSSSRRSRAIARPRQVAMFLCKQLTSRSLPEIGRYFGGRDHTTVIHAVKKVEELVASDPAFAEDVELLSRMLEA